eukprot:522299-Prymnesium_polylepis.1
MIRDIVTDERVSSWKLEKRLDEWANDWEVPEVRMPTAAEICNALFKHPPLEWSRIPPFQDRTMVLICQRLRPEGERRDIYLQGAASFELPRRHVPVKVYCSPCNPGARELAEELNEKFRATRTNAQRDPVCATQPPVARGQLLEIIDRVQSWHNLSTCEHMLVYLNAQTWTYDPETFAAEIREAQ